MQSRHSTQIVPHLFRRFAHIRKYGSLTAEPRRPTDRRRRWLLAAAAAWVSVLPLLAQASNEPQETHPQKPAKWLAPASPDRGQQVFEQNCSRCHNPPEGFSQRISGTIPLHMRVRANLSAADYKALLHFLNP
jgi:hypothetical protein